ncbi:YicC family protein [candidate division KSB1 bacterium 4484_87]|nr:MAG: YicC family protein [candidate division KSB1 bacterium 4484_87]
MIKSMTGFGRAELAKDDFEVLAEVRSVNNRFLDVQVKLPKQFYHLEHEVKNIVRDYIARGRVNVYVNLKYQNGDGANGLEIDDHVVRMYLKLLENLKKKYRLSGKIKIDHLLNFTDIFSFEAVGEFKPETWEAIKETIIVALENFSDMRTKEGSELEKDLRARIGNLERIVSDVEKIARDRQDSDLSQLRDRVRELIKDENVDEQRLQTEIALMVNRMDVTEECVRFRSHNKMFLDSLATEESIGKKLNFILQEMTREANTMGSKANHAEIAHLVVDLKEEVEKIREQVQNIE